MKVFAVLVWMFITIAQSSAQSVLCDPAGLSGSDYLYFNPTAPSASDTTSIVAGRLGYFQPIGSLERSGTTLNVMVEAYLIGVGGPAECAVVSAGKLAPGTYTVNLYFKNRTTSQPFQLLRSRTLTVAASSEPGAFSAPGDLDRSFGTNGAQLVTEQRLSPGDPSPVLTMRVRPDGRILVMGLHPEAESALYQFNADGTPDRSFGAGTGKVVPQNIVCSRWFSCRVYGFDLQPDGKIVIALGAPTLGGTSVYAAGRLLADGSVDKTFGVDGATALSDLSYADSPAAIVAASDGSVLVGGGSRRGNADFFYSAARFLSDGAPDPSFGTNARVAVPGRAAYMTAFRLQPDGKMVWGVRPSFFDGVEVVRALPNGNLDAGFGNGGTYLDESASALGLYDLAIQGDGRLVVVGNMIRGTTRTLTAMRLTATGTVDTSYGRGGITSISPVPGRQSFARSVAIDSQGRLVVSGVVGYPAYSTLTTFEMLEAAVVRLTPEGAADLTFAPFGATHFWRGRGSDGLSVAIAGDDAVLVGGTAEGQPYTGYFDFGFRSPLPTLFRLNGGTSNYQHPYIRETEAVEFHHAGFDHYFLSAYPEEIVALDVSAKDWKRTGKSFKVWTEESGGFVLPVCRFFSDQSFAPKSSHFYTHHAEECAALKSGSVWKYEGVAFFMGLPAGAAGTATCPAGSVPLYRLYNDGMGGAPNHRYTSDYAAATAMVSAGWRFEPAGSTNVFACIPQ